MKTFRLLAVSTIVAMLGALPGVVNAHAVNQAATKGTIKIASHSPLSGGQSQAGVAIRNGVDLAIRERGNERLIESRAGWVINCTGPSP